MRSCGLLLVVCALAAGCGGAERPQQAPQPTQLVLSGDGELWVVDVAGESVRHVRTDRLAPGDPPYRVVRRGDRFVFWGYTTYASEEPAERLHPIADKTWFFIPSSDPNRVWVAVLDEESPATENALKAVREVTARGEVTVPDVEPPGGRWPHGAVNAGLLFYRDDAWSVWDPLTRRDVSRLRLGAAVGPTHADLIASCSADPCAELWLTDARTGERRTIPAPHGRPFAIWAASFSPDGALLAVPVGPSVEEPSELAIVDATSLEVTIVPDSTVDPYYVFTAWSEDGSEVFITGGERFHERTILAYRIGQQAARRIDVRVGDFYGIAAR